MARDQNIFLLGRRESAEDQLTEMLVWLATAVPEVGLATVELGLPNMEVEPSTLTISTQHRIVKGRLDALIESDELLLVVESKLDTDYGDGRLVKYLNWLGEEANGRRAALMTLTAKNAPWPSDAVGRAEKLAVVAARRRWTEFYESLASILEGELEPLSARLVEEFADMMKEEGLVPVKPLEAEELVDLWNRSDAVIQRYHDYFRACKDELGKALGSSQKSNHTPSKQSYIYQEFVTPEGELITIGFESSDKGLVARPRRSPTVWFALYGATWPTWDSVLTQLESHPPHGWTPRHRWYGQPRFWRYLGDVVAPAGTFDAQRSQLADPVRLVRQWVDAQRPAKTVRP